MSNYTIARRYSSALFKAAEEKGILAAVESNFTQIAPYFKSHQDLVSILSNPVLTGEEKFVILKKVFPFFDSLTSDFFKLIIEKKREPQLAEIVAQFLELADKKNGILRATAVTTNPLTDDQKSDLIKKLTNMTGKKIVLTTQLDSEIKGGLIVKIGDTVYNSSVSHRLEIIKKRLMN